MKHLVPVALAVDLVVFAAGGPQAVAGPDQGRGRLSRAPEIARGPAYRPMPYRPLPGSPRPIPPLPLAEGPRQRPRQPTPPAAPLGRPRPATTRPLQDTKAARLFEDSSNASQAVQDLLRQRNDPSRRPARPPAPNERYLRRSDPSRTFDGVNTGPDLDYPDHNRIEIQDGRGSFYLEPRFGKRR